MTPETRSRQPNGILRMGRDPRIIRRFPLSQPRVRPLEETMAYKETFWMACDSTEQLRAEYGPFHTRGEAEREARRLGFAFLLRYEHMIGDKEDIQEVRCIFIELPAAPVLVRAIRKLHTRCATCGENAVHDQ